MNLYQMRTFDFNGKSVQVVDIGGEPWFVAKDLDEVLGFRQTSDMAKKLLKPHEYQRRRVPTKTIRRERESQVVERVCDRWQILISESGLYTLTMRSWKPEAQKFSEWVTSEVLPSIRKTGRYEIGQASVENYSTQRQKQEHKQLTIFDSYKENNITRDKMTISTNMTTKEATMLISIRFNEGVSEEYIENLRGFVNVVMGYFQNKA